MRASKRPFAAHPHRLIWGGAVVGAVKGAVVGAVAGKLALGLTLGAVGGAAAAWLGSRWAQRHPAPRRVKT